MFTGLIKEVGRVDQINSNNEGAILKIHAPKLIEDINIDDSVSVNGVCLTATKVEAPYFYAQCVHVTLEKTSLSQIQKNSFVNLELALAVCDRLGGHIVQGHVNGTASIKSINNKGENIEIWVQFPNQFKKYFISEGSVALDGISLTIAKVKDNQLCVSIIPHTLENTNLKHKTIGSLLNIEIDIFAKYIENFLRFDKTDNANKLTQTWLAQKGF